MRQGNLTEILRYVRDHGASSRHDIARGCGLGISTMTDLIGELRSRRLVKELDPVRRPGAGRPTRPIAFDGEPWCVLGVAIDIDHARFAASTMGGRDLWTEVVRSDLRSADAERGLDAFDADLRAQLARIPNDKHLISIEIGVPGYVAGDQATVSWSEALDWRDAPLGLRVNETLESLGVRTAHVGVSSDDQLAALYATRTELGLPSDSITVYLGGERDLGSGFIVHGEIFRGAYGGAGGFGPTGFDVADLLTNGGLSSAEEADRLVLEQPQKAIQMIVEAADAADAGVRSVLASAAAAIAVSLDHVISLVNPHAVILGGYLGVLGNHLLPIITDQLGDLLAIDVFARTQIVALDKPVPRVTGGATLAARDACFYDPLALTRPL